MSDIVKYRAAIWSFLNFTALYFTISDIIHGPNHFGQVQIKKISQEKSNLNLNKIIWTSQNGLDPTKKIWTVQKHFGPIEG